MKSFRFKQFTINQDQCAMKVGTDGVLLGAWTSLKNQPNSILDIGAGTGLIALMLAQRSTAELIDAVEVNDLAFEQCVGNFENSPWSDRLFCYHADFHDLVQEMEDVYDLIVSNPPFFDETEAAVTSPRETARQQSSLDFKSLLAGVHDLLSPSGSFSVIVPFSKEAEFLGWAQEFGFYGQRITRVRGHEKAPIKRSLLQLVKEPASALIDELVIEVERHRYTDAYQALTRDFYLKM